MFLVNQAEVRNLHAFRKEILHGNAIIWGIWKWHSQHSSWIQNHLGILPLASRLSLVTGLYPVGARCLQTCLTLQQSGSSKEASWSSPLTQAVSTKVDGVTGSLWLPPSVCRGAALHIRAPDVSLGTCQQDCHWAAIRAFLTATPCRRRLLGLWGHTWRLLWGTPCGSNSFGLFLHGPNTRGCMDIKERLCVSSVACVGVQVENYTYRHSHEGNGDIYLGYGSFVTSWLHSVVV